MQVKPEVHALFHSYIDEQHTALALHTADSKAGKLVRTSDARILMACCHHFAHLCKEQPRLRDRASEAFRVYMMVCFCKYRGAFFLSCHFCVHSNALFGSLAGADGMCPVSRNEKQV
jgi:hypothetical protein